MVTILGWLLMVACILASVAAVLGWVFAMGVFAVSPRRARQLQVTARVTPRVSPPPQRVHVTLWPPSPVKGEIER